MPKKVKANVSTEPVEEQTDTGHGPTQLSATREDYLRARAVIQLYRENQKSRPKRKCSEKQLAALAKGREANPRARKKEANQ